MSAIVGDDYQLLHAIGEGAYGTVAAALHKPSGRQVAIKKILPFDHTLFCLRTLRELKLLKFFSDTCPNENVLTRLSLSTRDLLTSRFPLDHIYSRYHQATDAGVFHGDLLYVANTLKLPPTYRDGITVIQELMQTDLHRVIRTQHLTDDHCQVCTTSVINLPKAC